LDTSKCYNNIFQLKEFAEYKNSKAYGQTMLGEINSIDYYESNITKNKYLITFETTYQAENLNPQLALVYSTSGWRGFLTRVTNAELVSRCSTC
jgi:hypothetical protein